MNILEKWNGTIEINGVKINSDELKNLDLTSYSGEVHIVLSPLKTPTENPIIETEHKGETKITVKAYMTKPASPEFDFMLKWNNNNPMPLRTMAGTVIKETKGMVYMQLHGDIFSSVTCNCMRCGKKITNKASQFFGMGPECGGHNYVTPFDTEEELADAVADYKVKMQNIVWEGWIIKSAITESEDI